MLIKLLHFSGRMMPLLKGAMLKPLPCSLSISTVLALSIFIAAARPVMAQGAANPTGVSSSSGFNQPMAQMKAIQAHVAPPPPPLFDPRTYGAKGDGITYDTAALQAAIDACAKSGGSVYLSGGKFLSAQLTLRGGMTFYIEKDAVLLGGTNPEDYPVLLPDEPTDKAICRSLLYAAHADGLVLDGVGVIDGQGPLVKMFGKEPFRPSLVRVFFSKNVTVRNLTLNNPRMWTQVYLHVQGLILDHLTVNAPKYYENLDGMDVYDCSDATVSNCRINSDDDSICLKTRDGAGLHNITVENNEIHNTGANAIKIGTASRGPITGIRILNNTVYSAALGGLCVESVDGSAISDLVVRGLDLYKTSQPIFIRLARRSEPPGSITGVTIENVRAVATSSSHAPSCTITGVPGVRVGDVLIKNSYFEMPGGVAAVPTVPPEKDKVYPQSNLFGITPAYGFYVRHADGVVFDHVTTGYYKPDVRPWLASDDGNARTIECHDLKQVPQTKTPPR